MFKKLILQSGIYSLGTIYGFVIGFFIKIYLIHKIGVGAFGEYMVGQTFLNTILTIISLALPTLLVKYLTKFLSKDKKLLAYNLFNFSLFYTIIVGLIAIFLTIIFNKQLVFIFKNHSEVLKNILVISSFYIPFILLREIFYSSFRAILKVKEIVIYGSFIYITLRALLILIVFYFTSNVLYLLYIEIFSLMLTDFLLFFNIKKIFKIFIPKIFLLKLNKEMIKYWEKMYIYALIGFIGGYVINWELSIFLPPKYLGIYSILLTLAGLSAFIITNVAKIFSSVIVKLVSEKQYEELKKVYKDTTFIISFLTFLLIIFLAIFKKDLLLLYSKELIEYKNIFIILLFGYLINAFVGNSGLLLLFGGGENKEVLIRILNLIFTLIISLIFVKYFGLIGAIITFTLRLVFINLLQVIFVYKFFHFLPWNKENLIMFFITDLIIIGSVFIDNFTLLNKLFIFFIIFLLYIGFFYKKLKFMYSYIKGQRK